MGQGRVDKKLQAKDCKNFRDLVKIGKFGQNGSKLLSYFLLRTMSGREQGVIKKKVFSQKESVQSLRSLSSPKEAKKIAGFSLFFHTPETH